MKEGLILFRAFFFFFEFFVVIVCLTFFGHIFSFYFLADWLPGEGVREGLILFRAVPGLIAIGCILICSHTSTAKFSGEKENYFLPQICSLSKVNHTLSLCLFNDVAIQSQAQAPEARSETSVYCLEYFYPALFL